MKKLAFIFLIALAGCGFKPSHYELIEGGFKENTLIVKGDEVKMYSLQSSGFDLQYYSDDNTWIMEAGGYAAHVKMTRKKFHQAIKSK